MAHYKYSGDDGKGDTELKEAGETLTRRVYRTLHDDIVSGVLRPGHRLVRKTIARELGVSPMPITEALYMLEVDGLVENRALYGCRVRPLTLEDVRNDQVLREAIECQAARMCAERAAKADLTRLMAATRLIDRMMSTGHPQSKLGMQLHLDFHMEIARAAGFASLADELQRVWFRRYMRLNWIKATNYTRVPKDWHQQLVQALATRDPDRAEAAMRAHVRYGYEDDEAALQYFLEDDSAAETPEHDEAAGPEA
jgi:GntR family transcriptional regulator, rspAB operon transcriptional repressor